MLPPGLGAKPPEPAFRAAAASPGAGWPLRIAVPAPPRHLDTPTRHRIRPKQGSRYMPELTAIIGITTALAIGAASPGPSFVMVARTAAASTRGNGLCAALGMGIGGLIFAVASLLGLHGVLLAVPSLYGGLKIAGGVYLAYLGVRIWRGAGAPLAGALPEHPAGPAAAGRSLALGLATQLSNPKTAIVYASVFAAFLPPNASPAFNFAVAGSVFLIEAGWYSLVAIALSSAGPRAAYLRLKAPLDRAAGGILFALGVKLVLAADRS